MHARNIVQALLVAATAASIVTSCAPGPAGSLAHAEQIASSCPADQAQVAALVQVDRSGSRRSPVAAPAEEQVIREAVERTAICGGHLRVALFSGSMIGVLVFDADLHLDGATANSRLRKAPKAVDEVMEQVTVALPEAIDRLGDGATDIVGQYQHGAEYVAQLSAAGPIVLEQTIVSDGIQTASVNLGDPFLTEQQAVDMAGTITVPDLTGASVRLIGIGRQADDAPLPTPYIAALRTFHIAVCEKTGASCTVVTDAAGV